MSSSQVIFRVDQKILKKRYGIMDAHIHNIIRSIKGEPLSGNKVAAFNNNLVGDLNSVTIDVWMQKFYNVEKLNKTVYNKLSDTTREIASKFDMKPAEMQAVIWTQVRQENNFKPVSFTDMIK